MHLRKKVWYVKLSRFFPFCLFFYFEKKQAQLFYFLNTPFSGVVDKKSTR